MISQQTLLIVVLAPLLASILAGLAGRAIGRIGTHSVTILGVGLACGLSIYVLKQLLDGAPSYNENVYTSSTGAVVAGAVSYLQGSMDRDAVGRSYDTGAPYATWSTRTYTREQPNSLRPVGLRSPGLRRRKDGKKIDYRQPCYA